MVVSSALIMAVFITISPFAIVVEDIIPIASLLTLVADNDSALRPAVSSVTLMFWWRHRIAVMWRHFFLAVVVVMFAVGRELVTLSLSLDEPEGIGIASRLLRASRLRRSDEPVCDS